MLFSTKRELIPRRGEDVLLYDEGTLCLMEGTLLPIS